MALYESVAGIPYAASLAAYGIPAKTCAFVGCYSLSSNCHLPVIQNDITQLLAIHKNCKAAPNIHVDYVYSIMKVGLLKQLQQRAAVMVQIHGQGNPNLKNQTFTNILYVMLMT